MYHWLDTLQDVRFGARVLVRSPGFSAAAVLTLALGIGANTAMFSVVNGVLLKPLPFEQPDRLVAIWNDAPGVGWYRVVLAAAQYFTYRDEQRTFEDVAVWVERPVTLLGDGDAERIPALMVTDGFLPILGVQPYLGRPFTRDDDLPGAPPRVMITYGFWQERFGGAADVVGRSVGVNGEPTEVIGVLPRGFRFLETRPLLLATLRLDRAGTRIENFSYRGLARLKRGVTMDEARHDVSRMIGILPWKFPPSAALGVGWLDDARLSAVVHPLSADVVGNVGPVLWVLMGTIGLVLLIACANVANLFLVRADGRQRELAIRAALGAGRWRIARALLAECLVLALIGGVVGVLFAQAAVGVIRASAPSGLPRIADIALEPRVLLVSLLLTLVAGILVGSIPAARFATPRLTALRDSGRTASDGIERRRTRSALVVSEIALALVLLVAAGLMIRTFAALRAVDPGFVQGDQLMALDLSLPPAAASTIDVATRRHEAIVHRIEKVPGVLSVGLTSSVVLEGRGMSNPMLVEDFPEPGGQSPPSRRMKWIGPGYFETLGTRLVAGRNLTWNDVLDLVPVVLINERMAREYWPTPAAAVGRRIRVSARNPWREVVGVVANERQDGLGQDPPPIMYWPFLVDSFWTGSLTGQRTMTYVIRSGRTGSPTLLNEVREAIRSVERGAVVSGGRTFGQITADAMAQTAFALVLLGIAGAMSLLLAVVGIYGVVSYGAAQRTREIGIRVALGALPGDVTWLFVRHGLTMAALGVVLGVAGAVALSRLMAWMLFGVSATDPVTYLLAAAGLAAVSLIAGCLPAYRAARMSPVSALSSDR